MKGVGYKYTRSNQLYTWIKRGGGQRSRESYKGLLYPYNPVLSVLHKLAQIEHFLEYQACHYLPLIVGLKKVSLVCQLPRSTCDGEQSVAMLCKGYCEDTSQIITVLAYTKKKQVAITTKLQRWFKNLRLQLRWLYHHFIMSMHLVEKSQSFELAIVQNTMGGSDSDETISMAQNLRLRKRFAICYDIAISSPLATPISDRKTGDSVLHIQHTSRASWNQEQESFWLL